MLRQTDKNHACSNLFILDSATGLYKPPLVPKTAPQAEYKPPAASGNLNKPANKPSALNQLFSVDSSKVKTEPVKNNFTAPNFNIYQQPVNLAKLAMPQYEQFNFKAPEIKADEKDILNRKANPMQEKAESSSSTATEYQKLLKLTNRPLYDKFAQNGGFGKIKPNFSYKPKKLEKNGNDSSDNVFEKVGDFFLQTAKQMAEASETSRKLNQNMMVNYGKSAKEVVDKAKDFLTNLDPLVTHSVANKSAKYALNLLTISNPNFVKLTQQEALTNTKNYAYNMKAYENNLKTKTAGPGIYINGQGRDQYKDLKFGVKGNVGGNGCMGISIYNSLISLNDYESLPDINYKLSLTDGTLLGGELGGNPTYIKPYLMSKGYDVESHYLPNQEVIENSVKNGDTAILFYGYTYDNKPGAHYITIDYDASDTEKPYIIYNENNSSLHGEKYNDLMLYTQNNNYPIAVYSIRK